MEGTAMANWRERLTQFMQGRYGGNDTFNKALFGVFLFFLLLAIFTGRTAVSTTLNLIAVAVLIYSYFRIFSRNIARRQAENQKFLEITAPVRSLFGKKSADKTHQIRPLIQSDIFKRIIKRL